MSLEDNERQACNLALIQLRRDIKNGIYQQKDKLPPMYELAQNYHVSRDMMEDILKQLEEENIVTQRVGIGTFVNSQPIYSSGIEQLRSVTKMIKNAGKVPGTQYIAADIVEPTDNDRQHFHPKDIRSLAKIERLRTADSEPVVYCIDKVEDHLLPLEQIHNQVSIFQLLEQYSGKHISYAVAFIEPIGFDEKISSILNCQHDQALLLLKQIHYTEDDEPVLYSANYFRTDVFNFYVVRKRM
ncbi:putative HTH-type transcriptional regulator YmfC [Paraliobacillus quinghaiensis]|uniref:HTH-type transcriptional regulator YmfC n=1 Tax=Paraliobacillus quinghaiensis TaxID=470815 RepID=A0A917TFU8_9BACI|nr:GntR family transcriptional regulator [Paraliobacillus quinghaiensis]GGM21874.1 putative HTH-type transcriptional regulator YmfC [Paraliobacillus quinghaiensis]